MTCTVCHRPTCADPDQCEAQAIREEREAESREATKNIYTIGKGKRFETVAEFLEHTVSREAGE